MSDAGLALAYAFYRPPPLTLWQRMKFRLYGRVVVGVDVARDGSETTVKGCMLNGKLYITSVSQVRENV